MNTTSYERDHNFDVDSRKQWRSYDVIGEIRFGVAFNCHKAHVIFQLCKRHAGQHQQLLKRDTEMMTWCALARERKKITSHLIPLLFFLTFNNNNFSSVSSWYSVELKQTFSNLMVHGEKPTKIEWPSRVKGYFLIIFFFLYITSLPYEPYNSYWWVKHVFIITWSSRIFNIFSLLYWSANINN